MNARCPNPDCESVESVINLGGRRGSRVADHHCPDCGTPLVGITAGVSKGRYLDPIGEHVVTLGLTGAALTEPMILVFQPGLDGFFDDRRRAEPTRYEREDLDRVAGKVLGPGCVVSSDYDPHRHDDADDGFRAAQAARAGLRLVPAPAPVDPNAWLVNEVLAYRKCKACSASVIDTPDRHMPAPWLAAREYVPLGRHQRKPVKQGPHPADSIACHDCEPR